MRPLGSIDTCIVCGGEYTVTGPNQRYCPDCAPCAVMEVDAAQGLDYYEAHKDDINPARRAKRRGVCKLTPCPECGRGFVKRGMAVVCPSCRPAWKKHQRAMLDARRSPRKKQSA